jgi:hypothetical protein
MKKEMLALAAAQSAGGAVYALPHCLTKKDTASPALAALVLERDPHIGEERSARGGR